MQFTPERAAQILSEARRILAMDEEDPKKLRRLWTSLAYIQGYDLACTLGDHAWTQCVWRSLQGNETDRCNLDWQLCSAAARDLRNRTSSNRRRDCCYTLYHYS